ncbi:P-loop NTPase fold protein [Kribbella sp. NPDC023855]|uniref:KAP family P-loop NTPase fold protein n=1 Tax=Kribbella sp. NPDC023855 TaxID=3154698 RepID=UPI0033C9590D
MPTHTDGPAYFDELGREGFARVLAQRIWDARKEETRNSRRARDSRSPRGGAFILHLHAPWGAGKTSVLNFLAADLRRSSEEEKGCVVVEFNAWRHQRIVPPWWWLMTTLYSGAVRELWRDDKPRAAWLWFRERLWRSKAGWPGYLALLLVAGGVVWAWQAGWFGAVGKENLFSPDTAKGYLAAAAAIVTPVLTIWGLLHAMGRWVFTTSARGARRFMANTSDPMRTVQDHVDHLTRWIGHDVVVMIDDLDRCKGPYVVELLEGIQTLFRDVPVTYVIAADRDWLADSYAAEYSGFVSAGGDAGRPVGYLFLEKTFQISTGLPRSGASITTYWNRLLHSSSVPDAEALKKARADSSRALQGKSGKALRDEVIAKPGNTPAEQQARLETVAVEMVSERAQQQLSHTLEPFSDLLGRDPNPRAMKRLVNAYGIARGIEILHRVNLTVEHLHEQETALWTILMLRWPKLAGHLGRYPEHLQYVGTTAPPATTPTDPAAATPNEVPAAIPAELRPLFADPEVVAVVRGEGVDATLTAEFLEKSPLR